MRILDVPCGEGRIAGRLARHGCDVVGVDQSELFLEIAEQRWPSVSFVRADMRQLAFEGEFDAVVSWFTSFGYFDRTENDEVLVPAPQLVERLHDAGFAEVRLFGRDGTVFEPDGSRLIALAERT